MNTSRGIVLLVGAGPGDPGLITVRGQALLETADVVVYDRLIGRELLARIPLRAERIDAGKSPGVQRLSQEQISAILVDRARRGLRVVRLKGGDPFVFGRGYEELAACREAGVDCVVVPGVTSAIAGPAAAGIPVTLRGAARSFAVVTAETAADDSTEQDYFALAGIDTVVILMGRANLRRVANELLGAGRDPRTPATCIERATTSSQRVETATLATIADAADRAGLSHPMITVVGEVAALASGNLAHAGLPLAGKRIVLTRPRSTGRELESRLLALGAIPIWLPMIRIVYNDDWTQLDRSLGELSRFPWIIFSSIHAVRAFRRRLHALGKDARALAACRIAAVGSTTAKELRKLGVRPDVVPNRHTGVDLAAAVVAAGLRRGDCALVPRGNLGGTDLSRGLREAGADVSEIVVYSTVKAEAPEAVLDEIHLGVDAVLFFSPSAVRRFCSLGIDIGGATIACVGPASAAAAGSAGMHVDVVAKEHSAAGLVAALTEYFRAGESPSTSGRRVHGSMLGFSEPRPSGSGCGENVTAP